MRTEKESEWLELSGREKATYVSPRSLCFISVGCAGSLLLHRLLSSCSERGFPWVAELRLLTAEVSLVEEHRLWGPRASVVVERGPRSGGSQNPEHRLGSCVHGLTLL